jgi:hypothetical protein
MKYATELTPELKQRLLKTWAVRSRLRAIELVEAELAVSHVNAIAIIDSLEPEYLESIRVGVSLPFVGKLNLGPEADKLILTGLFSLGFFCFWLAGVPAIVMFVGVFAVTLIGIIAYGIGTSIGG